jgi:hypothetical protein
MSTHRIAIGHEVADAVEHHVGGGKIIDGKIMLPGEAADGFSPRIPRMARMVILYPCYPWNPWVEFFIPQGLEGNACIPVSGRMILRRRRQ